MRVHDKEWMRLKPEMPFGQLPVLEIDGQRLAQSHSIVRFLARQYGLAGKSAFEEALVDSITDQYKDFFQETRVYFDVVLGYAEGDLESMKKTLILPASRKFFGFMTRFLKNNPSG